MAHQAQKSIQSQPVNRRRKRKRLKTLAIVVLIVAIGLLTYQYIDARQQIKQLQKEPAKSQQSQDGSDAVVAKVAKLTILPAEQPTVATVSDINKLRAQPFFANAKNGDRVLIFKNTKKAIIYRPSTNQIVEIAPIIPGVDGEATNPDPATPAQ